MTSHALVAPPPPAARRIAGGAAANRRELRPARRNLDMLVVCSAAMALGSFLDGRLAAPPALAAACVSSQTLWGVVERHWSCMPAAFLLMLLAGPAWIALNAMATLGRRRGASARDCRESALAALGCHGAMLAGMAGALWLEPRVAALASLSPTSGAAVAAMACGMIWGLAAASLCGRFKSAAYAVAGRFLARFSPEERWNSVRRART